MLPRYPIYVISKGRHDCCLTARCLVNDKVPFKLVIEPQELDLYAEHFSKDVLQVLPFSNLGLGSIPARNWVWEDAKKTGALRHWILDDNFKWFCRRYAAETFQCDSGLALAVTEEFIDRYENIAIGGLNYDMFVLDYVKMKPFQTNCHVYSCLLILNELPYRWRGRYNEDTDLCLQVLANGWCTVLLNAFSVKKLPSMTMKGGNTEALYQGDGRLKMARSLERMWPGVVETKRRYGRPQHVIKNAWRKFTTPLILKPGIDLAALPDSEFGMELKAVKEIKTAAVKKHLKANQKLVAKK